MDRFSSLRHCTAGMAALLACIIGPGLAAQEHAQSDWSRASHLVMPQTRSWSLRDTNHRAVVIEAIEARVAILEHTAKTTLDIQLRNTSSGTAEAILLLPVPDGAAVSSFMFQGAGSEPTAQVLRADDARREYESIVAKLRDPALLEFAGYNLIRSSVFPVEGNGTQRVRLTYENILDSDGDRIDYILPRTESLENRAPWDITVDLLARSPISMVYSPSHDLTEMRHDGKHLTIKVAETSRNDPGAFRLSYLLERDGVTASLFAYPDPSVGGGYFLMLAGLPAKTRDAQLTIKREVTLVLDRSGSMAGGKLDQVRAAALQIIEGLEDGEAFNIIDYSNQAALFARSPVLRTDETTQAARNYLRSIRPNGGTNIHDALLEALQQEPIEGMLPIVLFLTDGLPTVSKTSELDIRGMVEAGNTHNRRVFTFGVGADVNVPLLDRLAETTRATTTYVLPNEDVELKVAQTFKRLYGPVLADIHLETLCNGVETTQMLRELIPNQLPDVFEGDQIIMLGQYREDEPVTFKLSGNFLGNQRTFEFTFDFSTATTRNAFVPRLWATRRIAYLVDQIRQDGAITAGQPLPRDFSILDDPKYKEITEEIVRLSTEFGILSEYTAFLATEGTDLTNWDNLIVACEFELNDRAIRTRSGLGAVSQGLNVYDLKVQSKLKYDNHYWNRDMENVTITSVQQINDCAFFKQGNQWIDSRLIAKQAKMEPDRIIEFGTPEHFELLNNLVKQRRQGCLALSGDILITYEGQNILVKAAGTIQD